MDVSFITLSLSHVVESCGGREAGVIELPGSQVSKERPLAACPWHYLSSPTSQSVGASTYIQVSSFPLFHGVVF